MQPENANIESTAAAHVGSIERVLIADDDKDFRSILVRRAEQMGLDVTEVEDGEQAIAALKAESFDLILLDLWMPKCSGLEVFQAAHEIDPDLQAIVLTGSATLETAVEALRCGVYDYLTKPLESLAELELAINRALAHRRLLQENARLFAEVQRLAITDPLTGLFNRRKLDEMLMIEVERAHRYNRPLSLIMLDLDGMKSINDRFGHPAGDEALKLVADKIRKQIRSVDLPTRYGGDEFVILLPEADLDAARSVAKRICAKITSTSFHGEFLSVSAGVAQWSADFPKAMQFLKVADQAMYQAKRAGGRRLFVLSP
jgi:two-component system cell cycle response regulator